MPHVGQSFPRATLETQSLLAAVVGVTVLYYLECKDMCRICEGGLLLCLTVSTERRLGTAFKHVTRRSQLFNHGFGHLAASKCTSNIVPVSKPTPLGTNHITILAAMIFQEARIFYLSQEIRYSCTIFSKSQVSAISVQVLCKSAL